MQHIIAIIDFLGPRFLERLFIEVALVFGVTGLAVIALRTRIRGLLASLSPNRSPGEGAASVLTLASVMVLVLLSGVQVLEALGFAVGVGIGALDSVAAVAVALVVGYLAAPALSEVAPRKLWATATSVFAGATVLSVLGAGVFYDVSWDGNATYQQAILRLAAGWNPFAHSTPLPPAAGADFWAQVYPKGSWLDAAGIFALTGHLEQAKADHLLLVGVNFALGVALLLVLAPGKWKRATLLGALIAFNPVATTQVFTFMYDGEVASLLFAWALLAALVWTRLGRWPVLVGLAAATLLLAEIKDTALVYVVVFGIAVVVASVIKPPPLLRWASLAVVLASVLTLGVVGVGYSPYVTNTLQRGAPMYPVVGSGSLNLMAMHMPGNFVGKDRVTKLLLSVFSTSAEAAGRGSSSTLKAPFALTLGELRPFAGSTTRVGGWGPWFGGAVLLALFVFVLLVADRRLRRDPWVLAGAAAEGVVLVSVLLNPEAWWARYAPQLWLVPLILAAVAMYRGRGWTQRLGYLLALVLVVNALLVWGVNTVSQVYATARVGRALEATRSWTAPVRLQEHEFVTTWEKYSELRISYRIVPDSEPLPTGIHTPYLDSVVAPGP